MAIRWVVCIKQVPMTGEVAVDPETGNLMREGVRSQMNPYDLHALEAALLLREQYGGTVAVLSMGPPQAEAVLREALAMGADEAVLLTDPAFAGADTLATSFTLAAGLRRMGFDFILMGMQTSDGDTAQVGPGVAEFLAIPHVSYVQRVVGLDEAGLRVVADWGDEVATLRLPLPGLITVTPEANQPRLPSLRRRRATAEQGIVHWDAAALSEAGLTYWGLSGSPTRVEHMFPPDRRADPVRHTGTATALADILYQTLKARRDV